MAQLPVLPPDAEGIRQGHGHGHDPLAADPPAADPLGAVPLADPLADHLKARSSLPLPRTMLTLRK